MGRSQLPAAFGVAAVAAVAAVRRSPAALGGPLALRRRAVRPGPMLLLRCPVLAGRRVAPRGRPARQRTPREAEALGVERVERPVAVEVDPPAVADGGGEGAAVPFPKDAAGVRAEGPGEALVERRLEDEVADDRRGARGVAAELARPADRAGLGVERVEAAVVGADPDGRRAAGHGAHGGGGVDVVVGDLAPGELAGAGRERVDRAVGGAEVDPAVLDGGRRV